MIKLYVQINADRGLNLICLNELGHDIYERVDRYNPPGQGLLYTTEEAVALDKYTTNFVLAFTYD